VLDNDRLGCFVTVEGGHVVGRRVVGGRVVGGQVTVVPFRHCGGPIGLTGRRTWTKFGG
jgi:hypothetical protein